MWLMRTLPRIAAEVLKNTHVAPKNMKEKFLLLGRAYGEDAVEQDFRVWCQEQVEASLNPRYPLTDYIKVVDARLGKGFSEPSNSQTSLQDPTVAQITSVAYEEMGYLPSNRAVSNLLRNFTVDEILAALREYTATLDDKELRSGIRQFFVDGGAAAVIYAMRKRATQQITDSVPSETKQLSMEDDF